MLQMESAANQLVKQKSLPGSQEHWLFISVLIPTNIVATDMFSVSVSVSVSLSLSLSLSHGSMLNIVIKEIVLQSLDKLPRASEFITEPGQIPNSTFFSLYFAVLL